MAVPAVPRAYRRRTPWTAPAAFVIGAVLLSGAATASATAPGANGRIAYEFFDDNADTTLRDVLPGGRPRQLTVVPRRCRPLEDHIWHDEQPTYSPDGNWIAYRHEDECRRDDTYRHQIRLVRADGRGIRILLSSGPNHLGYLHAGLYPVFSRDGKRILSIARGSRASRNAERLWIIDVQSGRVLRRTRVPAGFIGNDIAYSTFDWAPNGRVALYLGPRHGAEGIFSGHPGAPFKDYRRITSERRGGSLDSWVPALDWSPSGKSMLFERDVACSDSTDPACDIESEVTYIYRVFMKGGLKPRRLTHDGGSSSPVFSPDGKRMAFDDYTLGGVVVRRLGGGTPRLVASGSDPAWQPVTAATLFR
jgi:Tol biopolymer transport system component